MKKTLIAAGILGAFAATAHAQSSVTLYGTLDAGLIYTNNQAGHSNWQQGSGSVSDTYFGLRGSEDLGGGLKAFFTLESGINVDDGSYGQGAFWGRQAFVGLGTPYGKVSLGRQYGSVYTLTNEFSQFSNVGTGASTAVIGGFGGYEPVRGSNGSATGNGGPARVNNSIKLESLSYNGFSAGALWGMGEVAGDTKGNRVADIYGRYTGHGVDAMVSVVDDKADSLGQNLRTVSAAAAYDWNSLRFNGGVMQVNDRSVADKDGKGYWLGASYRLGQHLFKGQYVESKNDGALADGKTQAFGVGYQYDLSKRTALYSSVTRFKNEGDGYVDRWASAVPAGLTTAGDRDITEFTAGIRHSF